MDNISVFNYKRAQILIFDSSLQLVDSVNLMNGVIPLLTTPLKIGDRLFWSASFNDTINLNPNFQQLVILELDTNYHYVTLHKVNQPTLSARNLTNLIYVSNHFFIGEWNTTTGLSTVYKLNNQFIKTDSIVLNTDLTELHETNGNLMLSVSNYSIACQDLSGDRTEKLILDTNLNIVNCFTFSKIDSLIINSGKSYVNIDHFYSRILPLSKTKTLAIGNCQLLFNVFPLTVQFGIVNCIINQNNTIIKTSVYGNSVTNTSYVLGSNIVDIKQNEILTVGCIGYNFQYPSFLQPQKTKIFVNKIDTLGNLIWQREHGGDMYYNPTGIIFTPDGGYLISGLRYDSSHTVIKNVFESFLLKLDANGVFDAVGIMDNGTINYNVVRCYPNPATNNIFFDLPFEENIELEVYNSLGQLIIKEKNYENLKILEITNLDRALYYCKIKTKTHNYTGKFVKE